MGGEADGSLVDNGNKSNFASNVSSNNDNDDNNNNNSNSKKSKKKQAATNQNATTPSNSTHRGAYLFLDIIAEWGRKLSNAVTSKITANIGNYFLIVPMITVTIPKLFREFVNVCESQSLTLKRATLIKSEINGCVRGYLETARELVESGICDERTKMLLTNVKRVADGGTVDASFFRTRQEEAKEAFDDLVGRGGNDNDDDSVGGKFLNAARLEKTSCVLETRIAKMLLPWIAVCGEIDRNRGR